MGFYPGSGQLHAAEEEKVGIFTVKKWDYFSLLSLALYSSAQFICAEVVTHNVGDVSSLTVPKFIVHGSEKSWKNTVRLLEYVAQFAVAGNFGAWMTEEGKVLLQDFVEPQSDRIAVQAYLEGRRLSQEYQNRQALRVNRPAR